MRDLEVNTYKQGPLKWLHGMKSIKVKAGGPLEKGLGLLMEELLLSDTP